MTTGPHDFIVGRPSRGRPTMLTPELREELCAHLAQGAPIKTACEAVGISKATYYSWRTRGKTARDEPPPSLELSRQGLIDLLAEADVTYPARSTKTALLRLLTLHRQGPYLEFLESIEKATAVRTLESLARIELGAQGGALQERTTTTRTAKNGTTTTTVRERWDPTGLGALTDGFSSGGIRLSGLGVLSRWCRIMRRLRRWTRWWGSMTSCGWHDWPARNGRTNLPRPARPPLVADQVSPAVTLAAMARQVFFGGVIRDSANWGGHPLARIALHRCLSASLRAHEEWRHRYRHPRWFGRRRPGSFLLREPPPPPSLGYATWPCCWSAGTGRCAAPSSPVSDATTCHWRKTASCSNSPDRRRPRTIRCGCRLPTNPTRTGTRPPASRIGSRRRIGFDLRPPTPSGWR